MNNIEIVNNSALHGGGIFVFDSSQIIMNNSLIAQNFAISNYPNYPIYTNEGYGGIEASGATIILNGCTISNNQGGGMFLKNGSQVTTQVDRSIAYEVNQDTKSFHEPRGSLLLYPPCEIRNIRARIGSVDTF